MSDRPIIFSAPMVRALLDGKKTQTRRVVTKRPALDALKVFGPSFVGKPGCADLIGFEAFDRLWVREAFGIHHEDRGDARTDRWAVYRADGGATPMDNGTATRWKPSIHMPRWASRLTLHVTDVRVQRLQEISREDAIAEGCESPLIGSEAPRPGPGVYLADERTSFAQLWNRLKGPGSWDANPWVVAVSFVTHMRNIDHE